MQANCNFNIKGHVVIQNKNTGEILLDKDNAIHIINFPRAIGRAMSNYSNGNIYSLCLGNGGSRVDSSGNQILLPSNDGSDGSWQSTLYNQTYAEVVQQSSPLLGSNPYGYGGGSVPADDPAGTDSVTSQELSTATNIIISDFLNANEPTGQLSTAVSNPTGQQTDFIFNEMGLFTSGLPLSATNGISSVNVNNMTSTDIIPISPNLVLTLPAIVNGTSYTSQITIPSGGTGSNNSITFGDFCEGFNNGSWITNGDPLNTYLYAYITDDSQGTYPSIVNAQSGGYLTFESKISGSSSTVNLTCDTTNGNNFFTALTNGICPNVNVNQVNGQNAGVQNDPANPANEAQRLLTHITFPGITKSATIELQITYTLTVTVQPSQDSVVSTSSN